VVTVDAVDGVGGELGDGFVVALDDGGDFG
jgi:hypothetical protein